MSGLKPAWAFSTIGEQSSYCLVSLLSGMNQPKILTEIYRLLHFRRKAGVIYAFDGFWRYYCADKVRSSRLQDHMILYNWH